MLSSRAPSDSSTTCDSLQFGPTTPPSFQVAPWSSLWTTCDWRACVPATLLSHGTTSRPAFVWMATPGPVAYHVHSAFFTSRVISTGFDHVAPSSVLLQAQTVRPPLLVPAT